MDPTAVPAATGKRFELVFSTDRKTNSLVTLVVTLRVGGIDVVRGWLRNGWNNSANFDHATGMGRVHEHRGLYHDGVHVKRNTLLLLISAHSLRSRFAALPNILF